MNARGIRQLLSLAAAAAVALTCAETLAAGSRKTPAAKDSGEKVSSARSEQSIVILVNDEPITGWEIEQRANLLATGERGGGVDLKAKAEARWKQIMTDPKTNERFQQLLKEKNVRSKEEAMAVQASFVKGLQQNMIEQIKREARSSIMPKVRKQAQEELIEEKIKLLEAKKLGLDISDEDIRGVIKGIAENNKMTEEQFAQHVKQAGFDVSTMKSRFKAQIAWREVVRRKFGAQISVNQRDIERALTSAGHDGADTVELQVHKISLPLPGSMSQTVMARRYAEADALRSKFAGCKSMAELARSVSDARFDDMKYVKPGTMTEPTRSMLLSARDGDMLPPVTSPSGIEVYAVCGRRAIKDEKQQQKAAEELQQREFDLHARRYLNDLKQDAHIEYR
ncbi:MAG: peptidylprolyl isomerase [Hyphomicrobiaceae bacterium]|nr:peptidylprolyl isomerase [Hyphomicrobiaceae bacterium]